MKFFIAIIISALLSVVHGAPMALKLERSNGPSPTFKEAGGIVEIRGPMALRATPAAPPDPASDVLEMEYLCVGGVPEFAMRPGPPFEAAGARNLPAFVHSEEWKSYTALIAPQGKPMPEGWRQLRLDLPLPADRVMQIRNARLRPALPGEFESPKAGDSASLSEKVLEAYLARRFSASITKVSVGKDVIRIEGQTALIIGQVFLADIPLDLLADDPRSWQTLVDVTPAADGTFKIDVPRHRQRNGLDYDRLASRWQLVGKVGDRVAPISNPRYAEWVTCRTPQLPPARPANKKGLGGWHLGLLPDEIEDLGISAVTVNVMVHSLISLTPGPDTTPFQWQGRTYHANDKALAGFDATFLKAQKHNLMVSAILLIANPAKEENPVVKLMGHPDATKDGIFAMPNVTSEEGISLYGAALNLMAERWSKADGKYGRVHHWIMHNEVDAGWMWTNAGEKAAITYMDLYQRSLRLMDLIARQYDPNSRPFISLTHFWAGAGDARWYGSKRLIDLLVQFTQAEGDFPWALAYHPYPQDLFNPRTWEDKEATFAFGSHLITPKNLEVLDAYMKQPALLYQGKGRPVHLSENGFNSKDYSPKSLEEQAAGMALAWKKIAALSSIQSWQYHNWIDNRGEGGLKIGLRKFPDEPGDPLGRKPIWDLYQALGTPKEDAAAAVYLKTIGIRSWDEIIHRQPIR